MVGTDPIVSPSESNPIRARITAEDLRELDRMARGHMAPVIDYGDCWECETTHGESFVVPSDVHPIPDGLEDGAALGGDDEADEAAAREWEALAQSLGQYMPEGCGGDVKSATVCRGRYLCRMSASGYMDCTDWESHDTAQGAADSLIQSHGD